MKRVLVVDDDRDLLDLVSTILSSEGYDTETAEDGQQALESVEHEMPDVILLDMKMPVMDGWTFAKEFHARYDSCTPIVVLTADADARRRAEEIHAQGWVGKPFELDELLNAVARFAPSDDKSD